MTFGTQSLATPVGLKRMIRGWAPFGRNLAAALSSPLGQIGGVSAIFMAVHPSQEFRFEHTA